MQLIDTQDFNIFKVRESTKENELITVTTVLFYKLMFFSKLAIPVEKFMGFVAKI